METHISTLGAVVGLATALFFVLFMYSVWTFFFFFTPLQFRHMHPKVTSKYLAFNIQITTH